MQSHYDGYHFAPAVKDRFVAEPYPAWTAIGISALAFAGALVEIRAFPLSPSSQGSPGPGDIT